MIIVALRDKVSGRYEGITMAVNEYVAKRDFAFAVENNKELAFKSKDLELYVVAEFKDEDNIVIRMPRELICTGDQVINYE